MLTEVGLCLALLDGPVKPHFFGSVFVLMPNQERYDKTC